MLKSFRFWAAIVLTVILAVCLFYKAHQQKQHPPEPPPAASIVTVTTTVPTALNTLTTSAPPLSVTETSTETTVSEYPNSAAEPFLSKQKYEDMQRRVATLSKDCPDFIGWLYLADSSIDYAVVQGADNFYYLSHAPDGREYQLGTIFLDYRCDRRFSDSTNILFGHNMVSGMFGDLRSWRSQEAFDAHRYGWLLTPDALFRIDFFALSVTSGYDALYDVPCAAEEWRGRLLEQALFARDLDFSADDRYLMFSTCAADFEAARLQFTGRLVTVSAEDDFLR